MNDSATALIGAAAQGEFLMEYLLILAPFAIVGWLARKVYLQTQNLTSAFGLFLIAVAVLGLNCAWGYHNFDLNIKQEKWTAAAMATGQMAILGFVVAGISWYIAQRLIRDGRAK